MGKRGRAGTVGTGLRFKDKDGVEVLVKDYVSATKVLIEWPDGTQQYKSAQQLRSSNFTKRTRTAKPKIVAEVQKSLFDE